MNLNRVLYDYIVKRYGSVVDFAKESGISLIDLNAVLLKENVFEEIGMGFNLCGILNIDVEELVLNGQVKEKKESKESKKSKKEKEKEKEKGKEITRVVSGGGKTVKTAKNEIYAQCIRLSESEKIRVLEYMTDIESISEEIKNKKN